MKNSTYIGKREFIQHTSQYLKQAEQTGEVIITHHNKPTLKITKLKIKSINDLKGSVGKIIVKGDINEPVLPGFDQW